MLAEARAAAVRGDPATARDRLIDCLARDPGCIEAYRELAALLMRLGFAGESEACLALAAAHVPGDFGAQFAHAGALAGLGLTPAAIRHFEAAIALDPRQPAALNNLGLALAAQGREESAEQALRAALVLAPDVAEIHANLGDVLRRRGALEAAATEFLAATRLKADWPEAWNNLGVVLRPLDRIDEAMAAFERALALRPDFVEATYNLGNALVAAGRPPEAAVRFGRALELDARHAEAAYSLGNLATEPVEAAGLHARALEARPDFAEALTAAAFTQLKLCHWTAAGVLTARLRAWVEQRPEAAIAPLNVIQMFDDPVLQQRAARQWNANRITPWIRGRTPRVDIGLSTPARDRLRIGYLSADFRDHAVGRLVAAPLAAHDRRRFHVTAYSTGPDDRSAVRQAVEGGAEVFRDLRAASATQLAARIAADGIDILVDLTGYTEHSRSEALALRCAPVQASYLGFPGTMGAPWIDFVLTDERLTPPAARATFDEAFAFVPGGYFVSPAAPRRPTPTRASLGLPEDAVVFCCFNAGYKIRADVFATWMLVLLQVPGSVLWLLHGNQVATNRLREAAAAAGVAPDRLCFAGALPYEAHSARLAAADLFLDTWTYAAGATAGQTLAAGVPLLAFRGAGYGARMSSALLGALGLDELVTTGAEAYAEVAVALGLDAGRRAGLRGRVQAAVDDSPLFDARRSARRLEAVYERLWRWHLEGRAPVASVVP